jgi:hypothetical protein
MKITRFYFFPPFRKNGSSGQLSWSRFCTKTDHLSTSAFKQGDQIWRIFTVWAIVHFRQFLFETYISLLNFVEKNM